MYHIIQTTVQYLNNTLSWQTLHSNLWLPLNGFRNQALDCEAHKLHTHTHNHTHTHTHTNTHTVNRTAWRGEISKMNGYYVIDAFNWPLSWKKRKERGTEKEEERGRTWKRRKEREIEKEEEGGTWKRSKANQLKKRRKGGAWTRMKERGIENE